MKKIILAILMVCSTVFADLITTFDFDITDALSWTPGESGTFYYNVAYFTVSTNGSYTCTKSSYYFT